MPANRIDVRVPTTARPRDLYALLRDGATWPVWSPIGSFELRRPAADEPEGVGAIRVFRTGRHTSVERIAELVPDRRLSYELVSGLAIRDYRADIDLEPDGDTTTIHWHSAFRPKVPGTGWLYARTLTRFIRRCAEGLAEYAVAERSRQDR
ncbi:MAG TPA: SRPBCC family protein [Pseudonocardiaceae bacterium]|nr:SRPBCC family protein [Pseudonocardiaceae bacterium]